MIDLSRFIKAQEGICDKALAELRDGRKRTHWMWFIFPQVAGLGESPTAMFYAIKSREEAEAYLNHHVLGRRLRECVAAVNAYKYASAEELFGYPDCLKFISCMTLFAAIRPCSIFSEAIVRWNNGQPCERTLRFLEGR